MTGTSLIVFGCVALVAMTTATTITIDKDYQTSTMAFDVDSADTFIVKGLGNGVGSASVILHGTTQDSQCLGMCFDIKSASFDREGALSISSDNTAHTFKSTNVFTGLVCTKSKSMTVGVEGNTEANNTMLSFDFEIEITNFCDDKSISFKEAAALSTGFQYGDEIKKREMSNYLKGLALGLALAVVWFSILIGGVFYLRCNPQKRSRRFDREEEDLPLTGVQPAYISK